MLRSELGMKLLRHLKQHYDIALIDSNLPYQGAAMIMGDGTFAYIERELESLAASLRAVVESVENVKHAIAFVDRNEPLPPEVIERLGLTKVFSAV